MDTPKTQPADRRSLFQRLVKKREENEKGRRGEQRYSLEGLRLAGLLKQMQALQAIQGLQELAPRKPGTPVRVAISPDREERARQKQWLEFKADWLQAMLEDTLAEIEALDRFERELKPRGAATEMKGTEENGSGPNGSGPNGSAPNGSGPNGMESGG